MPRHEITLQAFVSSPGDVSEERAMLEDIVRELNLTWSKSLGLRVDLIKWETHVTPGMGVDPQGVINTQIGDDYDIFIGIMWARFGTDTGRFGSGTEEEFERAYARYLKDNKSLEIMFYFKEAGIQPSSVDIEQLGKVLSFKKRLGAKGALFGTYTSRDEFVQHLRVHLSRVVQSWKANHAFGATPSHAVVAQPGKLNLNSVDEEEDDIGFLDAVEISQDKFEKLAQIADRVTEITQDVGKKMTARAEQMKAAANHDNPAKGFDLKAAKRATDSLAEDMENFVARMKVEIPLYAEATKVGIEAMARAANLLSDFNANVKEGVEASLCGVKAMLVEQRKLLLEIQGVIKSVASWPRVTSAVNKARRHTIAVLEEFGGEVGTSINLFSEVEKLLSDILEKNRGLA